MPEAGLYTRGQQASNCALCDVPKCPPGLRYDCEIGRSCEFSFENRDLGFRSLLLKREHLAVRIRCHSIGFSST